MEHIDLQNYFNLKCNSINNYVKFIVSSKRKETEQFYNNKFNSFLGWKVGKIKGDEIKDAIVFFVANGCIPENIVDYGEGTVMKYAILIDVFKKLSKDIDIVKLTNENWFEIRKEYEKEIRIENEQSFDVSFEEKVKSKFDFKDENKLLFFIKDEVENILEDVYENGWIVEIRQTNGLYSHRIVIINKIAFLDAEKRDKIFNLAVSKLRTVFLHTYDKSEFLVKTIDKATFIDGYFQYSYADYF